MVFHFARIMFFVIAWLVLNTALLPLWPWITRRMRSEPNDAPNKSAEPFWIDRRTGE
jgi:hypothetical protein